MKQYIQKSLIIANLLALALNSYAQNDAAVFVKAGKDEASKLLGGYLQPITKGLASGVNDAWYSTAKPLGLGGFDIKIGFGASLVNDDSKSFTLNSVGMSNDPMSKFLLNAVGGNGNTKQPTVVGDGNSTKFAISTLNPLDNSRYYLDTISSFKGTASFASLGTMPFIQASVGLVKETEIMVRLMPITSGDFTSSGFGFGVKHALLQWIWGVEELPIDLSAIVTYNSNNLEYALNNNFLDADRSLPGAKTVDEYKSSQKLSIKNSGYQAGLILSKKLSIFTPYLGVSYQNATSEIAMKGIYPIQSVRVTNNLPEKYTENLENPVSFSSNSLTAYKATLGFRLKFLPITIGAEYNHSFATEQFSTFNAVFSINIQQLAPIFKL